MSLTWTQRAQSRQWYGIASSADGTRLVAVTNGYIHVSNNSGESWTQTSSPQAQWNAVASSATGQKLVAVLQGGQIAVSNDYGLTWSGKGPIIEGKSVASSADGNKVALIGSGRIYVSNDSGDTWIEKGTPRNYASITSSSDGVKLAAVENGGQIYVSTDSGDTWQAKDSSRSWAVIASSANGQILVAAVYWGQIYVSTDSGNTWLAKGPALSNGERTWTGATISSDGSVMAVIARYGLVALSTNSGQSFTTYQVPGAGTSARITSSANGNKLAVAKLNDYIWTTSTGAGVPATATEAISANALSTYMSSSTATSVALAAEVRAAIKAMTDATARATTKADYITAMRAKEPTLKIAVPQTDFATYIATFSNVPTAISSAAKPIDVILPSASNIVDITTASIDETKYTAIEMPVNTTMTVQDNGSTVGTLTYNGSVYTDGNGATYSVGDSIIFGTKKVTILGQGSALVEITNTYKSIEVNLNVEISANGTLEVLGYQPTAPSNIVIASTLLPVDALYDSSNNIALIEFWEPDDRDDIMAQLASTQTLGGVEGYRITAKKLALGLQNCLIGSLDAKSAEPFNAAPKYGAAGAQNGNRVMTGFGRFALMAYAHYIMGHVQATAAITNDTDFMKGMLSLNSDTLTDYKYANIGNYDGSAAPWTTAGDASDANLAVRLVKTLIDNNPTTSLVSNGAATTVANIVKQVIGQDASRATDEDNNKYSPENHGLLRFYPDDVIYVSINLTTPTVTVGTGQQVSGPTMEDLYSNATGDKKYTLKLTLGPTV